MEKLTVHKDETCSVVTKKKIGLIIIFTYEGKEYTEEIYSGSNDAWFNFTCLYPNAEVIDFKPLYNEI